LEKGPAFGSAPSSEETTGLFGSAVGAVFKIM